MSAESDARAWRLLIQACWKKWNREEAERGKVEQKVA
jgi:hypothetical protein